jgi:hypothetical protein
MSAAGIGRPFSPTTWRVMQSFVVFNVFLKLQKTRHRSQRLMPDQPWKGIRGIGNPLRHEYDSIEDHLIWQAVSGCESLADA